jgi:hypothetical protein
MTAGIEQPPGTDLAPLSLGETISAAVSSYAGNALQLWQAVAIVVVPLEALELIIRRTSLPAGTFVHDGALYTNGLRVTGPGLGAAVAVALIGFLAQLLSIGAVFRLVLDDYLGRKITIGESFSFAASKLLALVWISILTTVLVAIGVVLLIVPGVYLFVALSVAIPVLMIEGRTGFKALGRSRRLVSRRWWATFGRLIVAWVLIVLVSLILGALNIASALNVSSITAFLAVNALISAIEAILTAPFTAAIAAVIYVDLRVRKEGVAKADLDARTLAPGQSGPIAFGPSDANIH